MKTGGRPGLVSVTFRALPWARVIELARECALEGIEWGGDVHVPPGEVELAAAVGEATRRAGLEVAAYGSYYRIGLSESEGMPFAAVLRSALALGAPCIRIWAGRGGSAEADESVWRSAVEDSRRIAEMAAGKGIRLAYEFHAKTLTDSTESTLRLLREAAHPNLASLWQQPSGTTPDAAVAGIEALLPWIEYVHVAHRDPVQAKVRLPLAEGRNTWVRLLERLRPALEGSWALLEFVKEDRPENLQADARTLRECLREAGLGAPGR